MRHAVFVATEEYAQVWRFAADVASLIVNYDSKEVHLDVGTAGFSDKGPGNRWLSKSVQRAKRARGEEKSPLIRQNTRRRRIQTPCEEDQSAVATSLNLPWPLRTRSRRAENQTAKNDARR